MRYFLITLLFVVVAVLSIFGLRGRKSTQPPVWVFPDMDIQAKYKPQGENSFFADGRNDRPAPAGAVMRGQTADIHNVFSDDFRYPVAENPSLYSGKDAVGEWYRGFPLEVTNELMNIGQEKYTIFCAVCHGASGNGNGITSKYGITATPTYHDDRLRNMTEGEIYNTIVHGKGLMKGYGYKLSVDERWAIIAYMRALQLANNASVEDVPGELKPTLGL